MGDLSESSKTLMGCTNELHIYYKLVVLSTSPLT